MHRLIFIFLFIGATANTIQAQLPKGISLFPAELTQLKPYGPGARDSVVRIMAVAGQPFPTAWQINTFNRPSARTNYGFDAQINTPLKKGDVLWISFTARSLESKRETGESFVELRFDQLVNGKYLWPSYLERGISIGNDWAETSVPFVMTKDALPGDVRFVIQFDTYPQRFEIGPVSFINYGPDVKLSELPRSVVHYEGDAPDAPWRKMAAERIEKYRKGDLQIQVISKNGKPVTGTQVEVRMTRNSFNWGTATSSQRLLDADSANAKIYRDTLLKYFNQVVFENEMKAKNWERFNYAQTSKGVAWLKAHHIGIRGHVMVWPSWQHSSPALAAFKNDTAALRANILKIIREQTTVMKGAFDEWDVINEPFAHHQFMDLLGRNEMVNWFKTAHLYSPGVKLFLNEYTMFQTEAASQAFYNNVKFLLDNGAPIHAIGEQAHIGGTPPPIQKVLDRLDQFSKLGLPIQVSEFDINSNDDDFKARYLGDFMTALYSHPNTTGFVQWGFWEGAHWFPVAALWDKNWNLRAHGKVFTQLVSKTWTTNEKGLTQKNGRYTIRGFTGEYEVTIRMGNKEVKQQTTLTPNGQAITIKL